MASFYRSLETEDFETATVFTGIHNMLKRSVNQLKSECQECQEHGALVSAIQKAVFVVLCETKPLLPSQVMKNGAALLLINFSQLKISWWKYWHHLEALRAKLDILRDLQNLESWIETMESHVETDKLGESLEETMALAEEHRKFSRAVTLQGEKCKRLAEFEMKQLEESDPLWETGMERQIVEQLDRLKLLPRIPTTPEAVSSESMSLQEDTEQAEELPFERLEGVLYRNFGAQRSSAHGKRTSRWHKCFAVLNPVTMSLHMLDMHGKRNWITENDEKDHRISLCREMATNMGEQKSGDGNIFKIHNLESGEFYVFKAKTRELARKWVAALNEASSKAASFEKCHQTHLVKQEIETYFDSRSLASVHKSRSTSCLPICRLINKRMQRRHRRQTSGPSKPSLESEEIGIRSLSPHSLLSSPGIPTAESCVHSRAVVALTLPIRVLRRHIRGQIHLTKSASNHPHFSADAIPTSGNSSEVATNGGCGGVSSGGGIVSSEDDDDDSSLEESRIITSPDEAFGADGNDNEEDIETDIDDVDEFS